MNIILKENNLIRCFAGCLCSFFVLVGPILFFCSRLDAQQSLVLNDPYETEAEDPTLKQELEYQLYIYDQVTELMGNITLQFGRGKIDANEGLDKIVLLKHEYSKKAYPYPKEAAQLVHMMKVLLSRLEDYFIHFKLAWREDPGINIKLARSRYELSSEADRLRQLAGSLEY